MGFHHVFGVPHLLCHFLFIIIFVLTSGSSFDVFIGPPARTQRLDAARAKEAERLAAIERRRKQDELAQQQRETEVRPNI
jgi:hypothetical protein